MMEKAYTVTRRLSDGDINRGRDTGFVLHSDYGITWTSGRDERGITAENYESATTNIGDYCDQIITGTLHASDVED